MTSPDESAQPEDPQSQAPEGIGRIVRRVLSHHPSAEEQLEQLLADRRRQLAEQAAIVERTLGDLERREGQLRDSKASIERLLRLGQRDLDLRESDLVRLGRELDERTSRVEALEAEVGRRRAELGAVELKRAAVEQRDRALDARETALEAREGRVDEEPVEPVEPAEPAEPAEPVEPAASGDHRDAGASSLLLFVPGSSYRLVEVVREPVRPGDPVDVDGVAYAVSRIGPSPLPGDRRRCAYLVRGGPDRPVSGGSS